MSQAFSETRRGHGYVICLQVGSLCAGGFKENAGLGTVAAACYRDANLQF